MPEAGVPSVTDAAHVALRLGRLMLINGADTEHVHESVVALVGRCGYQAHLLVGAEGLLLTLVSAEGFRTRLGPAISGMTVNMSALGALDRICRVGPGAVPDIALIDRQLDEVEKGPHRYGPWLVAIGIGITAAALARLFGGGWPVVAVSFLVGVVTQLLRQTLGAHRTNPVGGAALAAFGGGLIGALAMRAFPGTSPALCLVVAGMILVPGVPLLNGVRDTLGNHVGTGLSRLTLGTATILAIALGLFLAAGFAGDALAVAQSFPLLPTVEDLLFSALAGTGYGMLFNVPVRALWVCMLCAMAGHGLRTAVEHLGLELSVASLIGAFAATMLARGLAYRFRVPAVTFAFPGIVAMIPGAYAFRAGIGGLEIMHAGSGAPPALVAETIGLAVTTIVVTAAIAIGLCLALALPVPERYRSLETAGDPR
ncbi:MAG: threonine/serine exporter family protein [Enhydrobacter sp.]|nr:threonine/serine exporter family protein [Enhydrobacter sp.]